MSNLPRLPYYHIDSLISQGGTAAVYSGIDLRSGFPVAIKMLFPNRANNDYIRRKFKGEANHYLYLNHPHLTKLVDYIEAQGRYFLVMEFVEGVTLELYVNSRSKPMAANNIVDMFMQILDTIAFIHQHGRLHLDIKPNNIMVQPDGSIKVLDMGISVKLNDMDIKAAGTPPFMPPEQVAGSGVGLYTDIFALGVTLFHMVAGQLPFHGSSTAILEANRVGRRPKVYELNPHAHPGFQQIIEKAMHPVPQQRYQTCEEMMMDLVKLKRNTI